MTASKTVLPVTLITGFFGSGKTTLLNHLLRHEKMANVAVAINELGEVPLDDLFVRPAAGDAIVLANGCLCCVLNDDFENVVLDIHARRSSGEYPPFERLIVETTGLADPAPIMQVILNNPTISGIFALDAVVTTVDAVLGDRQLDEHAEALKQVALADVLLITKSDLCGPERAQQLSTRLRSLNPSATMHMVRHGSIDPDVLFGFSTADGRPEGRRLDLQIWRGAEAQGESHPSHTHDRDITAVCMTSERPLDLATFNRWMGRFKIKHADNLLRVKGLLNVGSDRPVAIHGVHHVFHPPVVLDSWPSPDHRSRIVFITRDLAASVIEAGWRDLQQ